MILIPLTLLPLQDDGFHLLVEVLIFGIPFKAVLDTGASKSVFDKSTIENHVPKQDIERSEHLSTGLGTNTMESYSLLLPELRIGDLCIPEYQAAILDFSTINTAYQSLELEPIAGVIGGDILHRYKAVINYQDYSLTLSPPTDLKNQ